MNGGSKTGSSYIPPLCLEKVLACLQHSMFDCLFSEAAFFTCEFLVRRSNPFKEVSLRDVWRLICICICIYIYIYI